jgi:hypothetical protein
MNWSKLGMQTYFKLFFRATGVRKCREAWNFFDFSLLIIIATLFHTPQWSSPDVCDSPAHASPVTRNFAGSRVKKLDFFFTIVLRALLKVPIEEQRFFHSRKSISINIESQSVHYLTWGFPLLLSPSYKTRIFLLQSFKYHVIVLRPVFIDHTASGVLVPHAKTWRRCYLNKLPVSMAASKSITVAARSRAWTIFALSNTGVLGSNPTRGINICVRLLDVCVVLCIGRSLATDRSPV